MSLDSPTSNVVSGDISPSSEHLVAVQSPEYVPHHHRPPPALLQSVLASRLSRLVTMVTSSPGACTSWCPWEWPGWGYVCTRDLRPDWRPRDPRHSSILSASLRPPWSSHCPPPPPGGARCRPCTSPRCWGTAPTLRPAPRRSPSVGLSQTATCSPARLILYTTVMWLTSCLSYLAMALLHTVLLLSTAQQTPVGPTLTLLMLPSILVHSLPRGSSAVRPVLTKTSSALLTPQTLPAPTETLLILPRPASQPDPRSPEPWPVPSL